MVACHAVFWSNYNENLKLYLKAEMEERTKDDSEKVDFPRGDTVAIVGDWSSGVCKVRGANQCSEP